MWYNVFLIVYFQFIQGIEFQKVSSCKHNGHTALRLNSGIWWKRRKTSRSHFKKIKSRRKVVKSRNLTMKVGVWDFPHQTHFFSILIFQKYERATCIKGLIWPHLEPKVESCFSLIFLQEVGLNFPPLKEVSLWKLSSISPVVQRKRCFKMLADGWRLAESLVYYKLTY